MARMNYLEAVAKIIREAGKPLSCQDIANSAIEQKLIDPQGSDLSVVLNSLIMQDLKLKGLRSEFSRIGAGVYTLRQLIYRNATEIGAGLETDLEPQDAQPVWDKDPNVIPEREPARGRGHDKARSGGGKPSRGEGGKEWRAAPKSAARQGGGAQRKRSKPEGGERRPQPVSDDDVWQQAKHLGMAAGYRAFPIGLVDSSIRALGWYEDRNPEIAFLFHTPEEGDNLKDVIEELMTRNFHKVVLVTVGKGMAEAREAVARLPHAGRLSLIAHDVLLERSAMGLRFLDFFRRLKDSRPVGEHRDLMILE